MTALDEHQKQPYHLLKVRLLRKTTSQAMLKDQGGKIDEPSDIYVWGYYDWARFEVKYNCLSDLYLWNENNEDDENKDDLYRNFEEQILCAYTGEGNILFSKKQEEYPLFVITEIRADEGFIKTDRKLEKVKIAVNDCFSAKLAGEGRFQILFSLGHSDLIVTSQCRNFQAVYDAIIELRSKHSKKIKSTYSVYGIYRDYFAQWHEANFQAASIFISLKSCVSLHEVKETIRKKINDDSYRVNVFPLFGKYDACIFIDRELEKPDIAYISKLFYDAGNDDTPLNEGSKFYRKHVNYTRTHWYLHQKDIDDLNGPVETTDKKKVVEENDSFGVKWNAWKFIESQSKNGALFPQNGEGEEDKNGQRSPSMVLALRDLLRFYWQIENNETADPHLCKELATLFRLLLENILFSMQVERDLIRRYFYENDMEALKDANAKARYELDSLEPAVHLYSDLLQNRVQATRMVLEAPIYDFKFINASTKIYLAYYKIVELVEDCLNDRKFNPENLPRLDFFVTMHHADAIKLNLLFPNVTPITRIIAIRIDKKSFFSPLYSLPRIMHEIGHFVNPMAKEKNESILETVCFDLAREIFCRVVMGLDNQYLYTKVWEHWTPKSLNIINQLQEIIHERIKKIIKPVIFEKEQISYESEFNAFCTALDRATQHLFEPLDMATVGSYQILIDRIQQYENDKEIELLQIVTRWMSESMKTGADISLQREFWLAELEKISLPGIKDFLPEMERLLDAYRNRQDELAQLAGDMSRTILEGATSDEGLLSVLQKGTESVLEKKLLTQYIFKKHLNENTPQNREHLQQLVLEQFRCLDTEKTVQRYQILYAETGADLFMKEALDLNLGQYIDIFNASIGQKNDEIMNRLRRNILEQYFSEPATKNQQAEETAGLPPEIEGFYTKKLKEYLIGFHNSLKANIASEMQGLREDYKSLSKGDRNITKDLLFLNKYWSMEDRNGSLTPRE